jgi:hypothetical protein
MPDLWLYRLDFTPQKYTPKSTGKAWSLQTSRQPTGDRGNTHNTNMDKKPVAKSILKAEIHRLHSETAALYQMVVDAQLPSFYDFDDMQESISVAVDKFRRASRDLATSDERYGEAFEPIATPEDT